MCVPAFGAFVCKNGESVWATVFYGATNWHVDVDWSGWACMCACTRVSACAWHEGEWLSCGFPQASRREFRAHLDEVITLKSRYSTLDQVNPLTFYQPLIYWHAGSWHPSLHLTALETHTLIQYMCRQAGRQPSRRGTLIKFQTRLLWATSCYSM